MWDKPDMLNGVANLLIAAALLVGAYGILHYASRLPVFSLREVHVTSPLAHVTLDQIETVVKHQLKGNFFTLDLEGARTGFEKLSWARKANARRVWPDRLEVAIEEHVPLARWGSTALVNSHGELFTAAFDGALPLFVGPEASAKEIAIQYGYFQRSLSAIGRVPAQVQVSARRAWQIKLDNGLIIELGRESMETRLDRFVAVFERTVGRLNRRLNYVDLRYPNGFALRIPEFDHQPRNPSPRRDDAGNTKRG